MNELQSNSYPTEFIKRQFHRSTFIPPSNSQSQKLYCTLPYSYGIERISRALKKKGYTLGLENGQDNFEASNGRLEKFKARRNIAFKQLHGEAGSVDANSVATWKGGIIPSLLAKYSPQDIFNADETGLFYKLLPNQTITIRGEKCEGGKKSKERITVLVCCNMDGSEKLPLLYIGKYRRPRCFHGMNIPSNYHLKKKAWMTGAIFTDWLKKLDQIFKRRERKILLILDNCPAHQIPEGLQNIEIRFLPALTTSALQPCDMGFVMDEAMEEVVEEEMNRCFEALKKHQAIDVNYIDFLEVDKDVQVAGEQSIEEIVKEVMGKEEDEEYGFNHITSSPRYPQSNRMAERSVKIIKTRLKKSQDPYLGFLAYRTTPLENGFSPSELLMGGKLRTNLPTYPDLLKPSLVNQELLNQKEKKYQEGKEEIITTIGKSRGKDLGEIKCG
ncbi:TIGD4 [Cordylochernes scorpioides]|uniref:TIGD4 n=1 Tax=Cordylochernes scorpioides TaxID=51811 RepID=A0ABY6KW66_9ARAC|nr:TIGD4 [Cordylochernes scorpioides]